MEMGRSYKTKCKKAALVRQVFGGFNKKKSSFTQRTADYFINLRRRNQLIYRTVVLNNLVRLSFSIPKSQTPSDPMMQQSNNRSYQQEYPFLVIYSGLEKCVVLENGCNDNDKH